MEKSIAKKYYLCVGLILISLLILIVCLFNLPETQAMTIVNEGGYVETLSAVGYFLGSIISIYLSKKKMFNDKFVIGFLLFVLGCRELDFHKAFTETSISSTHFYISSNTPILAKLIVTPIVLGILMIIFYFLKKYVLSFIKDLFNKTPYAIIIAPTFLLFIVGKIADSSLSILRDANLIVTSQVEKAAFIIEESFELGIPVFFILGLLYLWETKRAS